MKSILLLVAFAFLGLRFSSGASTSEMNEIERTAFEACVSSLPSHLKKIYEKRIDSIEFHDDFKSWAAFALTLDEETKEFRHIFHFRRDLLKLSLAEVLEAKDKSYFISQETTNISIKTDYALPAFGYVLAHEIAHVLQFYYQLDINPQSNPYWRSFSLPHEEWNFPRRSDLTPYKEARIPKSEVIEIYRELSKSPFASLYGATSLHEDFAELAALHYLTRHLDNSVIFRVHGGNGESFRYEPDQNPLVQERLDRLEKRLISLDKVDDSFDPFKEQKRVLRREFEQGGAGQRR